ncbi:MAG TPA: glycosyl hydrolase family 28 protein [Chitinophagaceae bacterium]|nr:glycosyl hydrolase family 28 protein [Chitinophagaceae bacterium]
MLTRYEVQGQDNMKGRASVYNIIDYGAKPDGKTINTHAIQQAVEACYKNGGGRIIVPAGNFVTGTIRLYSNMNFYLEPGAVLTGSKDNQDYLYQKDFGFTGPGAGVKTGILVASNEQNISVSGFGTIYGNGTSFMYMDSLQQGGNLNAKYTRQGADYMNPKYGTEDGPVQWKGDYADRAGVMIIFSNCKNVSLDNIKFQESPNWTVAFANSSDIKVHGIIIDNNMRIPNSDGLDFYDSKNIIVSDCDIKAGDDAIAVISSGNVNVSDCILSSRSSGIRVGYNVFNNNNSGNLIFNNIIIYDSNRGIGIFQRQKGNMQNMLFSNIIISTRLHTGQWWGHGEPIHISAVPGLGSKETGTISNVRFSNITAASESGIVIYAAEKNLIKDIYFDKVNISIKKSIIEAGYGGNIDLRPANDIALGIFKHNVPALYSKNADHISIRDFTVSWGDSLPGYFDHAIECTGFENAAINSVKEQLPNTGKGGMKSTVSLSKAGIADISNISSSREKVLVERKGD